MATEDECPVCNRSSELIFRVEETSKNLETLEGEINIKLKDTNKRIDEVDKRLDKLVLSSAMLFATALISLSVAVYTNLT
jgi:DNA repair exonuclease SbcCD ATPase subunit